MTARLYAFNTLAGAARSSTAVADGDTTAGAFNSTYVASAIKIPTGGGEFFDTTAFMNGAASVTTLYHRFDMYGPITFDSNPWMEFINSTGVVVAKLWINFSGSNPVLQLLQWNGSAYTTTSFSPGASLPTALRTWMVKFVCGASGTCEVYVGGALYHSFAVNQANVNNIAKVRTYQVCGAPGYYSQIMGADYDIGNANVASKLANGEGSYTAGTGVYTDINEAVLNDATAISLAASGDKHSFTKPAITVPGGQQIASMIVNARGRIGGSITDGKLMVRSGSTDSASAGKSFSTSYDPRGHAFDNDPASGTRWTQSGFNAAEFGLQAA